MTFTHKIEEPVELSSAQIIQMPGTQSAPAVQLASSTELAPVPDVLLPNPKRKRRTKAQMAAARAKAARTKKPDPILEASKACAVIVSDEKDAPPLDDGAAVDINAAAPLELTEPLDRQTRYIGTMFRADAKPVPNAPPPQSTWTKRFVLPSFIGGSQDGPPPGGAIADVRRDGAILGVLLVAFAILGGTLGWFFG